MHDLFAYLLRLPVEEQLQEVVNIEQASPDGENYLQGIDPTDESEYGGKFIVYDDKI